MGCCLGKYVERLRGGDKTVETFQCPTCNSKFTLKSNQDVADLTSSYFIKNMLENMAIQEKAMASATCSRCKDPAIDFCTTCEMLLCKKCVIEFHDFWPANKNHNVLSVEKMSNHESQAKMRKKLLCNKHEDKVLEIFCQTCNDLCCIHCLSSNHQKQNHSWATVNEVAQKQKETLQSSCTTLDEKLSEGEKALNNICEVMKSLEENAKTAKDQINEQKKKILKIVAEKLDEKAKKMNEEVDEVYGELHSELSKQHDEIKEYLNKVQASVSLPRNLLKRGSIEEILSSQKLIHKRIEKLGNEKPDDLDAVNDGSIQYVPDDIGMINVDEIVGKLGRVGGMFNLLFGTKCFKFRLSLLLGDLRYVSVDNMFVFKEINGKQNLFLDRIELLYNW